MRFFCFCISSWYIFLIQTTGPQQERVIHLFLVCSVFILIHRDRKSGNCGNFTVTGTMFYSTLFSCKPHVFLKLNAAPPSIPDFKTSSKRMHAGRNSPSRVLPFPLRACAAMFLIGQTYENVKNIIQNSHRVKRPMKNHRSKIIGQIIGPACRYFPLVYLWIWPMIFHLWVALWFWPMSWTYELTYDFDLWCSS